MLFQFENSELSDLYYDEKDQGSYPAFVVTAFFKKMQQIKAASSENDLRAIKGNHFEKLEGRDGEYSVRLNHQYRLIFRLVVGEKCKILSIQEISNHYS